MVTPTAIHVISLDQFGSTTAQISGSRRRASIGPSLDISSTIRGVLFEVEPRAQTEIHYHCEQETIAFVLSGRCEVRWGHKGEFSARAKTGDFIHVPAFLPHMKINPSQLASFRWIVVRSTPVPIVVNLPDTFWS